MSLGVFDVRERKKRTKTRKKEVKREEEEQTVHCFHKEHTSLSSLKEFCALVKYDHSLNGCIGTVESFGIRKNKSFFLFFCLLFSHTNRSLKRQK